MFAILFMDLDGFKIINDSLGHSAGDEILKAFAQRLLHCVRGGDTVARLGGDEFVVLLENLASPDDAANMAESVLSRMRQGLWADSQPLQVMPSIGISLFPQDGDTVESAAEECGRRDVRGKTWRAQHISLFRGEYE